MRADPWIPAKPNKANRAQRCRATFSLQMSFVRGVCLLAGVRLTAIRSAFPRGWRGEFLVVALAYLVTAGYLVLKAVKVTSYVWLIDEFLYTKGALGFAGGTLTGHVF